MKKANITTVRWGEIYLCDLGSNKGSVQSGIRPVLVIQNNIGNDNGPTTVVATISSVLKKLNQPTHILLDTSCGLKEESIVMLEQVRTVDKANELIEYIGRKAGVVSFNDDEEEDPPLHNGDVIPLAELLQVFPNLLKNANHNGIITTVSECGKKSSPDAIQHRLLSRLRSKFPVLQLSPLTER